jgi:antitoxin component of MazEF toxin-antitoxin module
MNTITTKLVPDGNSMAIRLPKQILVMSGLAGTVQLGVKRGQITIRTPRNPRQGWQQRIEQEIAANGLPGTVDDYGDMLAEMDATLADGLDR